MGATSHHRAHAHTQPHIITQSSFIATIIIEYYKKGKRKQKKQDLYNKIKQRENDFLRYHLNGSLRTPLAIFAHIVNYHKQKHVAQNLLRTFSPQQH